MLTHSRESVEITLFDPKLLPDLFDAGVNFVTKNVPIYKKGKLTETGVPFKRWLKQAIRKSRKELIDILTNEASNALSVDAAAIFPGRKVVVSVSLIVSPATKRVMTDTVCVVWGLPGTSHGLIAQAGQDGVPTRLRITHTPYVGLVSDAATGQDLHTVYASTEPFLWSSSVNPISCRTPSSCLVAIEKQITHEYPRGLVRVPKVYYR